MNINLMPDNTQAEIAQNVAVIIGTRRGTQPLDRDLGIDGKWLDEASVRGRALLSATIISDLPQQERRITVNSVTFGADDGSGISEPIIEYAITSE